MTTALPIINDATWARMGWRAQQQWLLAANRLRKQLIADVDARLTNERTRAAFTRGLEVDASSVLAGLVQDGQGEARLAAATREAYDLPEVAPKVAPKLVPKNSRRLCIDAIESIMDEQPRITSQELAHQFRVTADAVRKSCKRHGRLDLTARLRENSKVAA